MLSGEDIRKRLDKGEIFVKGSWKEDGIQAASYDLHIAKDFLIIGDQRHPVGESVSRIRLEAGQVALVSTKERFNIPWDLVGNMSPKWKWAKEGILVHTGSIVDPGFGQQQTSTGWEPRTDERVHFFLANVGTKTIELRPEQDAIATVQFSHIDAVKNPKPPSYSRGKVQDELFGNQPKALSLAFFGLLNEGQEKQREEHERLTSKVVSLTHDIEGVKRGYEQLTLFGVYVLGAALLTIFGSSLINGDGGLFSGKQPLWLEVATLAVLGLVAAAPIVLLAGLRRRKAKHGKCHCH